MSAVSRLLAQQNFTLRQLQYAVAVAGTLSFRAAAAQLHVSQPSLSAQLKELEAGLGVLLFERDRRGVMITKEGAALLERMREVLREAMDLGEEARRQRDPLTGTMTFGVIPTISPYLLPSLTPPLKARFSGLTVRWVEDKTSNLIEKLGSGAIDAALLALEADLGPVDHELVLHDPFVLCLPLGHPLGRARGPAKSDVLDGAELLLLEDGHCFRSQALALCASHGVTEQEFQATSLSTLVQMVAGGAGITLLPSIAVSMECARAEVTVRPLKDKAARRTIVLAFRKRASLGPGLRTVAQAMREAAELRFTGSRAD